MNLLEDMESKETYEDSENIDDINNMEDLVWFEGTEITEVKNRDETIPISQPIPMPVPILHF